MVFMEWTNGGEMGEQKVDFAGKINTTG